MLKPILRDTLCIPLVLSYGFDVSKKALFKTVGTVSNTLVVNFGHQESLVGTRKAFWGPFLTSM